MICLNILKGVLIGITMMIPGLSGGSCAMVLNVYEKLMNCIDNINIKNIIFLLKLSIGIIFGIFIFSFFLYKFTLFEYFNSLVIFIIILNILFLLKEYKKINLLYITLGLLGYISMLIIKSLTTYTIDLNVITYLAIGLLLAISLILPGLGATYVLYILGLYEKLNIALSSFDFMFLFSIGLSTIIGILVSAKMINQILNKDKFIIYSLVIGLLIGGI